ncbi:hypothetical protein MsAc7_08440 [Methanolapillus millepedarum]|uniref:Uncharacterized protein n=1 Tax=Methanolapillus millepedarum TaxID=3028296 RepID=A0AA97A3T7_9EURY|nr:hypothetical protein MsAc7_08440 [Methanosarcinaceae archaeon Ac7]
MMWKSNKSAVFIFWRMLIEIKNDDVTFILNHPASVVSVLLFVSAVSTFPFASTVSIFQFASTVSIFQFASTVSIFQFASAAAKSDSFQRNPRKSDAKRLIFREGLHDLIKPALRNCRKIKNKPGSFESSKNVSPYARAAGAAKKEKEKSEKFPKIQSHFLVTRNHEAHFLVLSDFQLSLSCASLNVAGAPITTSSPGCQFAGVDTLSAAFF